MFFGGGGGAGGNDNNDTGGGNGGTGGGILFILGSTVSVQGAIHNNGTAGGTGTSFSGAGGGGAGGAIKIVGNTVTVNPNVQSVGGNGGSGGGKGSNGGYGSNGRIRIEYCFDVSGSTNPPASTQKMDCYIAEQVESAPYTTTRLSLPESFTNGRTYRLQYGRKLDFAAAGELTSILRVPAGVWTNATLDALVSGVGAGDVTFKLDVGNDGTWDWETTQNVDNAGTFSSPDLTAAFAPYVSASSDVDVPVKVYLSKPGQVLLTNMAVTRNRSVELSSSLSLSGMPIEGTNVPLNATVTNSGPMDSGPLTVSYYATRAGQQTYVGSVFLPNIPAGGTIAAPFTWDTLSFTGPVTVTAAVDPFNRIAETDETNNNATANLTILTRPDLEATDISLSNPEPVAGEPVTVKATVANHGESATGTYRVALFDGNPDTGGSQIQDRLLPALDDNSTRRVTFSWTPAVPGSYRLFIQVDRSDQVDEFDESNNSRWLDVKVGMAGPIRVDSGSSSDWAYSPERGFGYLNGQASTFCGTSPIESQRSQGEPGREVQYRFDHLLPGHFYHLDLIVAECDSLGRQETIWVDGNQVFGTINLGDGKPHRVSLLLDPALYVDGSIVVGIRESTGYDALVSTIDLHDVDYRYSDSGKADEEMDPAYPHAPASFPTRRFGWLDGVANQPWGALPYQTRRIDLADGDPTDDPDNVLRYRYDGLSSEKTYRLNLVFFQGAGGLIRQSILVDGIDTGVSIQLSGQGKVEQSLTVPNQAYLNDGTIVVEIVREDAAAGAFVNEIALEEVTQSDEDAPPAPPGGTSGHHIYLPLLQRP